MPPRGGLKGRKMRTLGFSTDPDFIGYELRKALASYFCIPAHRPEAVFPVVPCKQCLLHIEPLVKPIGRALMHAGHQGRPSKIDAQVAVGQAVEMLFNEAEQERTNIIP